MSTVAYVTTTFPTLASFIESEVHRLRGRGVRVRVYTLRAVSAEYQPEHAPLLEITQAMGSPFAPAAWTALFGWLLRKPHVLIPEMIRIVWASRRSLYALVGHIGYLPAAARIASAVEAENFERVHGAWAHFPATVAYLAARLTGRPFSIAAHAGADLYRTQAFLAEKVRAADFTFACVRTNAEMLRAMAGPGARVEWIYHGVDLSRFDGTRRERDPHPLLLVVGRLSPPKGFDDAIRALGRLRERGVEARMVVVGDGPQRAQLESLAREQGVDDRVEFRGALRHEEILRLYRRAWVLLAPSRVMRDGRRDGIPNVIIEAMAMGVPCLGTRAAGLEEAIVSGETGALCDQNDAAGMADALEAMLATPDELERMGSRARQRVGRDFDAERSFERVMRLFNGGTAADPRDEDHEALAG